MAPVDIRLPRSRPPPRARFRTIFIDNKCAEAGRVGDAEHGVGCRLPRSGFPSSSWCARDFKRRGWRTSPCALGSARSLCWLVLTNSDCSSPLRLLFRPLSQAPHAPQDDSLQSTRGTHTRVCWSQGHGRLSCADEKGLSLRAHLTIAPAARSPACPSPSQHDPCPSRNPAIPRSRCGQTFPISRHLAISSRITPVPDFPPGRAIPRPAAAVRFLATPRWKTPRCIPPSPVLGNGARLRRHSFPLPWDGPIKSTCCDVGAQLPHSSQLTNPISD